VINIEERSIPLKNIQNVDYNASLIGRMFNYGNLRVESAGDSADDAEQMVNVGHAGEFRERIFAAMENYGADDYPGRQHQQPRQGYR
jgi:uncharacterized membrane protein YdbT with pleckstrin-like domain